MSNLMLVADFLGGRQAWENFARIVTKDDEQSAKLALQVYVKLRERIDPDDDTTYALLRLKSAVDNAGRWSPALMRNTIFKAANSLKIKLPSHMFASKREADQDELDRKWEEMGDK